MGIGGRPLAWPACLGLSLLCLAPAALRADPEDAQARSLTLLAPPWLSEHASADDTAQDTLADDLPRMATGVLGSLVERAGATWDLPMDREDSPLIVSPVSRVILSPSECSGLLMFQGLLFVGLYRGRRKWAAALAALLALTRSGIGALTEMIGLPKARDAKSATPTEPGAPMETHRVVQSPSLQRTYAGLLRRLAGEPAKAAPGDDLVLVADHRPATCLASAKRVAGSVVPILLPSPEATILPPSFTALYPSSGRDPLPSQHIPCALFARPPPSWLSFSWSGTRAIA